MAIIGLNSPSASMDNIEEDVNVQGVDKSLVGTPVRNNAPNLMALGQHILTPRKGRM